MTLYALRLAPQSSLVDDAEPVAESRYGWAYLMEAIALWRLANPARADALERFIDRAAAASEAPTQFGGSDLATLTEMLVGIEEALRAAGIIDCDGRVSPERLDELKGQVPAMDLETERSLENKTYALMEVILHTKILHAFLSKALSAGCVVVHD